ncbi:hypothetical protein FQR65_LT16276 [Abscondita terminalis]|nr:hypothetical protein FQR65_LT16276 [Abscondita terminalis]
MFRTHTNGELSLKNLNEEVTLSGWVQTIRDKGFMIWIDLRDRYGITQLVFFDQDRSSAALLEEAKKLGREFVIQVNGKVIERASKNPKIPTGEIEILVEKLTILNNSELPPFTIEDETDGGEELRMKYRYLDIRRNPVKEKLIFRHKMAQKVRNYLSDQGFIEVETPVLLNSTPEGARICCYKRMNPEAMKKYGNDKPDIRFGMEFHELNDLVKGKDFKIFDEAELVVGINVEGVCRAATGMVWIKYQADGVVTSSVNKFYNEEDLKKITEEFGAKPGDLMLVLSGNENKVRAQLSALRMELGNRLGLRKGNEFAPLWVIDFPLLEWDEDTQRYHAMHHPFTSPKPEDIHLLENEAGKARANAYDLVINGNEIGGGSIRIF